MELELEHAWRDPWKLHESKIMPSLHLEFFFFFFCVWNVFLQKLVFSTSSVSQTLWCKFLSHTYTHIHAHTYTHAHRHSLTHTHTHSLTHTRGELWSKPLNVVTSFLNHQNFFSLTSVQVILVPYCCLFCLFSNDILNVSICTFS